MAHRVAQLSVLGLVLSALLAFSCSGEKDDPTGPGGSAGNDGTAGSPDDGAGGDTSAGGSTNTSGYPEPTCVTVTPVPGNPLLTDFSEVAEGAMSSSTTWGDSAATLTGGFFFYQAEGNDPLTATCTDAAMVVTGTLLAGNYAGLGIWFGPACNDASAYDGIKFTISGDAGETQIQLQVQSSQNYPVDTANSKGECTGDWSNGCASNFVIVEGFGATPTVVTIPWAELTGGEPIDPINPRELLGMQWHFNCGTEADCTPNVTIDDVTFY